MSKICPICQYEAKHQGALNMHMYHCKMKNVPRETKQEISKECTHSWRLLNLQSGIEAQANKNGYMEVCKTCQTLR